MNILNYFARLITLFPMWGKSWKKWQVVKQENIMDEREKEKILKFKIMIKIDYSRETTRYFLWLCYLPWIWLQCSSFYWYYFLNKFLTATFFFFFRKDFIIYQEPNASPSRVTENGFSDKVKKTPKLWLLWQAEVRLLYKKLVVACDLLLNTMKCSETSILAVYFVHV